MNLLAIFLDCSPPEWGVMGNCIYSSGLSILVSGVLIRWRKEAVFIALVFTTIMHGLALMGFGPVFSEWVGAPSESFTARAMRAIFFSIVLPYVMIGFFYFTRNDRISSEGQAPT